MVDNSAKVLLVEDNDFDALMIERLLSQPTEFSFHLTRAERLDHGLKHLAQEHFDVVLLDLGLPDSTGGLNALHEVHAQDGEIPIIIITGMANAEVAVDALRQGAQDYVVKEQFEAETLARIIRYALLRVEHTKTERRLDELEDQFSIARRIQQAFFPKSTLSCPGYDLAGKCVPADATGGDYFDFLELNDQIGLVVGDVSGHGIGPAMLMSSVRSILRTLVRYETDVSKVLTQLNHLICDDMIEGRFVTLILVAIDQTNGAVQYAAAGHNGYLLDRNGHTKVEFKSGGIPIALRESEVYTRRNSQRMEIGDVLLLYTDGITETQTSQHEMFGKQRMLECVQSFIRQPASEIADAVLRSAESFRGDRQQADDMTILVLKRTG